jgi:2-phosphosulfolactate phosphatase
LTKKKINPNVYNVIRRNPRSPIPPIPQGEVKTEEMKINVRLLPIAPDPDSLSNHSVVVIDILRATSVIVHALAGGAREFIPVRSVEEAFDVKKRYPPGTTFLGGEKDTRPIEGFDLGNSPREYVAEKIRGKRILLRTTNGSQAFHLVSNAREVMVGSFFNAEATARRCVELGTNLLIFPSGDEGTFSLEDTVCGGMIIDQILKMKKSDVTLTDASNAALILFKRFDHDLLEVFHLSQHGNKLIRLGKGEDLPYCAQTNIIQLVPVFREGVIRVFD